MPLNSESSMINWWLQGLGFLIPTELKNRFSPIKRRILIQLQDEQLAVNWPSQESDTSPVRYHLSLDNERQEFSRLLSKYNKKKYMLVLCLPATKGLKKYIKLPLNAETDLANILEFEFDRQTPFTHDQIYSGYHVISKNKESNTLTIELNVVPNKYLDSQLAILQKVGIIPQAVEILSDTTTTVHGINVLPVDTNKKQPTAARYVNMFLILFSLILLGVLTALPFQNIKLAIKQTEKTIQEARVDAVEVNKLRSEWETMQERQSIVNNKIENHSSVTVLLEELTRLLPDDTWLSQLHIKKTTLRLQGESAAATNLISLIENSEYFSGTRFQSPVTSNLSTGNDRFQITTQNRSQAVSQVFSK